LENETVLARPASAAYRFRKLVRRHKLAVAAVGAVAAAIVLGLGLSTWLFFREQDARRQANNSEKAQKALRIQAQQDAQRARLAEADAREKLLASYLAQARADRWSQQAGRRFNALDLLKKAAEVRPSLELRNEAIACMTLPDLRPVREWELPAGAVLANGFDWKHDRWAFANHDGNITFSSIETNKELFGLPGFGIAVAELYVSPGAQFILTRYAATNYVRIWRLDQRKPLLDLQGFRFRTHAFAHDERSLAVVELVDAAASEKSTPDLPASEFAGIIHLYDLNNGHEINATRFPALPFMVQFDPTGQRLGVSFTGGGSVYVLEVPSLRISQTLKYGAGMNGLAWHPSGRWLAGASADGHIPVWDTETGQLHEVLRGHQSAALWLTFSHSGLLASAGWDSRLRFWDALSPSEICSYPGERFFEFSPDDRRLSWAPTEGKVGLLEVLSGQECSSLFIAERRGKEPKGCAFSSDGRFLATSHKDGLRLWSLDRPAQVLFQPADREIFSVRFHPSRPVLITSGLAGIQEWPVSSASLGESARLLIGQPKLLAPPADGDWDYLAFSSNLLAIASVNEVRLIDLGTMREESLRGGDDPFRFTALSPDGRWCAAGGFGTNQVHLFNTATGGIVRLLASGRSPRRLAFSPDSRRLVICGVDNYRCFDVYTGQQAWSLQRQDSGGLPGLIAFSTDNRLAALAYSAQKVRLVDPATGDERATLEPREAQNISSLAFSPDSAQLVVNTWTQTIQLWDLRLIRRELAEMKLDWEIQ
jgi:WD40 repeat protein